MSLFGPKHEHEWKCVKKEWAKYTKASGFDADKEVGIGITFFYWKCDSCGKRDITQEYGDWRDVE